jgi:hypothetical protein
MSKLEGVISSVLHPGLVNENVIFHDYFRQNMISGNSVWEQSAEGWEFVSYAMQKDCFSLQNRDFVPVHGIFVHGAQAEAAIILEHNGRYSWSQFDIYVGQGASFA